MTKTILGLLTFLLASAITHAQCTDLFISEYIEGSSNNKAIEIYNPTGVPVNLSGYSLKLYSNGSATPTSSVTLSGILLPYDVHVVYNTSAFAAISSVGDQTSNGVINYNGDDAVALFNGATAIDVFGEIGVDPGTAWAINGVPNSTVNKTLRRKPAVQQGTTTWLGAGDNQWDVFPQDATWYLGSHVMNSCGSLLSSTHTVFNTCMDNGLELSQTAVNASGALTYIWDFGDGSSPDTAQNITHQFVSAGTYIVTCIAIDGTPQVYAESFSVTMHNGPSLCFSPFQMDGCATDTLSVVNCSSGGVGAVSYVWDFDNGNTSTSVNPADQYYSAGTFQPFVIATDTVGCDDTLQWSFTVNAADDASFAYAQSLYCLSGANPVPTITGTTGGTFSCNGCVVNTGTGEINLSSSTAGNYVISYETFGACADSSGFAITLSATNADASITPAGPFCELSVPGNLQAATSGGTWSGNGIIDTNLGTFDPSAAGAGTHTITYTIAGSCGATDTETITVMANQDVVLNVSDTALCMDVFGANLSAVSGGTWSGISVTDFANGNGFFDAISQSAGTYYAVYTIAGMCGDADSIAITLNPLPSPSFTYNITGPGIDFTNTTPGTNTYTWVFTENGNDVFSNALNPTYIYLNPANQVDVCLEAINTNGCSSVVCNQIQPSGIEEDFSALMIYPNPAQGESLTLQGLESVNPTVITLSNAIGQVVYAKSFSSVTERILIPIQDLPSGTYFLNVRSGTQVVTKKITIL